MVQFTPVSGNYEVDLGSQTVFPSYSVSGHVKLDLAHGTIMRLNCNGQTMWLQADPDEQAYDFELGGSVVNVSGARLAWDVFACEWAERLESRVKAEQQAFMQQAYRDLMAQLGVEVA